MEIEMLEVLQKGINVYVTAFLELLDLDIPYKYKKEVFEIIKRANEKTKDLQKKTEQILYQLDKNSQLNQNKEGKHE